MGRKPKQPTYDIDMVRAAASHREVPGFPGYLVASDGTVFSSKLSQGRTRAKPRVVQHQLSSGGFSRVKLYGPRRDWNARVDSLVLLAFVGPEPVGCTPIHIDGDRRNNSLSNLKYSSPPSLPPITVEFGNWVAGFTDGEGSFGICNNRSEYSRGCCFKLKLRDDDIDVLRKIVDVLKIGKIYRSTRQNVRWGNVAEWSVADKAGCLLLVEFFDRFQLRSKKARDFAIWRQAVAWWCYAEPGNRWHGARDASPLLEFKRQLEEGRKYPGVTA